MISIELCEIFLDQMRLSQYHSHCANFTCFIYKKDCIIYKLYIPLFK